jgi:hypothetical protein
MNPINLRRNDVNTLTIIKKPKKSDKGPRRFFARKTARWERLRKRDAPVGIDDLDKEFWEVMHQIDRDGWIRGRVL